jgi:GNAT superfamily N-acetyltransferase
MELTIRALSPALIDDYLAFFDHAAFRDHAEWAGCYCMFYHIEPAREKDWDGCALSDRRVEAEKWIRGGIIRGYLAYDGGKVVGWCNANDKKGFSRLAADKDLWQEAEEGKVKSIVCFLIDPDMRGKGIAKALLSRVVEDAADEGYAFVEAYPMDGALDNFKHYHGHPAMFEKAGFETVRELKGFSIVRKKLS